MLQPARRRAAAPTVSIPPANNSSARDSEAGIDAGRGRTDGAPVRISRFPRLFDVSGSSLSGPKENLSVWIAGDSGNVRRPRMQEADSEGASTRSVEMETAVVESWPGGATKSMYRTSQGADSGKRSKAKSRCPTLGVKTVPTPGLPAVESGPRLVTLRTTLATSPEGTRVPPGRNTPPRRSAAACACANAMALRSTAVSRCHIGFA